MNSDKDSAAEKTLLQGSFHPDGSAKIPLLQGSFHPDGSAKILLLQGSFHPDGSAQNAVDFGPLGLLAYCCADVLLHVSLGNLDERDIESLAFLATAAKRHVVSTKKIDLMVLINAPRFADLANDPEGVLRRRFWTIVW